jgi:hypothetical protein
MIRQTIHVELDIHPEDAFLLTLVIQKGLETDALQKLLSNKAYSTIHQIAQSIVNQVQTKTDFDKLRSQNDLLGGLESN